MAALGVQTVRLRKPCEHDRYEEHVTQTWLYQFDRHDRVTCPGGEFLADDALIIEKVDIDDPECGDCDHLPRREWPRSIVDVAATAIEKQWARNKYAPTLIAVAALDALFSVREGAG